MRKGTIARKTRETDIILTLSLDGSGLCETRTGIGFFDHMLISLCRFALIDLSVKCEGDLFVDAHHTVEDVGICFGKALNDALGDRSGIKRVGSCYFPMDEALAFVALDVSGRPFLRLDAAFPPASGGFDTQLIGEFFRAVSNNAGLTLHMSVKNGESYHHMAEALFKAFGRSLDEAVRLDPRMAGVVPSTKGML